MNITKEIISNLNPCKDRFKNFCDSYPYFAGTYQEFITLDKITYDDKVWVLIRVLPRPTLELWALRCTYSVLEIYETKNPGDLRVRKYLEAIEAYKVGKITKEALRDAREASNAAAYANANATSADAAAYAAAYAAYAAAYADAADYAAAAASAYTASGFAAYAAGAAYTAASHAKTRQQNINLRLLAQAIEETL